MSKLTNNTTDLQLVLDAVNSLPVVKTCNVTIATNSGIILQMYCATTIVDSIVGVTWDSNKILRDENFTVPVTINNVLIGSPVVFEFTGAITNAITVDGDAVIVELGSGNYAVRPMRDCTITCYDKD